MRDSLRFFGVGVLIAGALWCMSERVAPVSAVWGERIELLSRRGHEIEAITLGNSHNRAIDFDALGVNGLHLWHSGGDVFEALYVLRESLPQLPRVRVIFFAISYPFLENDNSLRSSESRRAVRVGLYARAPRVRWIEGDLTLFLRGKISPLVRTDNWAGVARALAVKSEVVVLEDGTELGGTEPLHAFGDLERHGRIRAERQLETADAMIRADPHLWQRAGSALESLLLEAEERRVDVVAFIPPYHPGYERAYDVERQARLVRLLRELDSRHCNLVFLDYSAHPHWSTRDEIFLNGDHLNRLGAKAFSNELRATLDGRKNGGCSSDQREMPSRRRDTLWKPNSPHRNASEMSPELSTTGN